MKIRFLRAINFQHKLYQPGDEVEFADILARKFIQARVATEIFAGVHPPRVDTPTVSGSSEILPKIESSETLAPREMKTRKGKK